MFIDCKLVAHGYLGNTFVVGWKSSRWLKISIGHVFWQTVARKYDHVKLDIFGFKINLLGKWKLQNNGCSKTGCAMVATSNAYRSLSGACPLYCILIDRYIVDGSSTLGCWLLSAFCIVGQQCEIPTDSKWKYSTKFSALS